MCLWLLGVKQATSQFNGQNFAISENAVALSYCTLYVGLAHAAPPTQYKAFTAFSPNWLPEGSTLTYTCK